MISVIKFPIKRDWFNEQERRALDAACDHFNATAFYGEADDGGQYVVFDHNGDTIAHLGWTKTGKVFLDSAISGYSEWDSVQSLITAKRKQYEGQSNDYIVIQA